MNDVVDYLERSLYTLASTNIIFSIVNLLDETMVTKARLSMYDYYYAIIKSGRVIYMLKLDADKKLLHYASIETQEVFDYVVFQDLKLNDENIVRLKAQAPCEDVEKFFDIARRHSLSIKSQ